MAGFTLRQPGAELQNLIDKIAPTEEKVTKLSAELRGMINKKVDADKVATINGQSIINGGNVIISGSEELPEDIMGIFDALYQAEFNPDFNQDFTI